MAQPNQSPQQTRGTCRVSYMRKGHAACVRAAEPWR